MDTLSKILSNAKLAGVYRPAQVPDEIARAAKTAKLYIVKLDLRTVQGKSEFLTRLAKALKCPLISA